MSILLIFQQTPTEIIPLSGYLLCFIPLAMVIIGFIVAARYTDRQATATYLRALPATESGGQVKAAWRENRPILFAPPAEPVAAVALESITTTKADGAQRPFMAFLGNERPVSEPPPQNPTYDEMIPPIPHESDKS